MADIGRSGIFPPVADREPNDPREPVVLDRVETEPFAPPVFGFHPRFAPLVGIRAIHSCDGRPSNREQNGDRS
jgi:hypothetical protein